MVEEARRNVCGKCKRPPRVCYCSSLPDEPLAAEYTHVLVLQHEHEKKRRAAISSVPVLAQTLQDVTLVTVKDACDCGPGVDERLDALLYEGGGDHRFDTALVLFPDEHAQPLKKSEETGRKEKVLLIVIDGTWKQAKKIARRNREHWEKAANEWEERGAKLQYICLENDGKRSIYGDLRREPMEGCMSTLEAVASALVMLEVGTGRDLQDALLRAFTGMVSIQEQFQQRGRVAKLEQYGGVSKAEAVEAKRLELQRQVKKNEATDTDKSKSVQREYVFYTSHTDFRHRQQLTQEGDVVTSTYDEAREQCVELNRDRKRGQRVAMLPLDVFEQHLRQLHDA